jgi:hypothetical protein
MVAFYAIVLGLVATGTLGVGVLLVAAALPALDHGAARVLAAEAGDAAAGLSALAALVRVARVLPTTGWRAGLFLGSLR